MSRKQPRKTASYRGYIPTYLDEKAKKAIRANLPSLDEVLAKLERYAEDDYRFTFGYDDYNQCFSASLYDTSIQRPTGGYILAAKHSEGLIAISSLVYLHEKIFPDGWDIERVGQQEDVDW